MHPTLALPYRDGRKGAMMKSAVAQERLTLVILRDAQHAARQFQISRPVLLLVPAAALLSISALIISMHIHSTRQVSRLEQALAAAQLQLDVTVTNRNEALRRLQEQMTNYGIPPIPLQEQAYRLPRLEQQLQTWITRSQPSAPAAASLVRDTAKALSLPAAQAVPDSAVSAVIPAIRPQEYTAVFDRRSDSAAPLEDDMETMKQWMRRMQSSIPDPAVTAAAPRITKTQEQKLTPASIPSAQPKQKKARTQRDKKAPTPAAPSLWPTSSTRITSSFGYRSDPFHRTSAFHAGIDIGGKIGDPVFAAGRGEVIDTGRDGSRGNYIIIAHGNGMESCYMHLSKIRVKTGMKVAQGEVIGDLGSTGRSTGPHLHFQVTKNSREIDPLSVLGRS
ncbi:peptidoglycan DD-metalloendopeptidase family protein [Paenibacillus sp. JX-17]|uniref:Peptidoglycan DD-metalloendopeptidase family protein n=1 Tax=Paenibacillus lacisoli TaxID=3064525 RepID=A0ABT9CD77_9BACL|nr:peptidoglycan DD-metalloendopeptidase family protein [Paenibacillus sp. JX-17]MDO7907214.1 peptidoglycan DD-metalloendopeptidase family protein [Paenibacillus sp. JX-17]